MRKLLLLALITSSLSAQNVYHEASCPSVDRQRMVRMNRQVALASGLAPAEDCHPQLRARYLGISGAEPMTNAVRMIHVDSYVKKDGTHVGGYDYPAPSKHN